MTTEIRCLFDAMVKVKDLKPHPKNRNKHPSEQVDRLAKIIAYQGIRSPIKVSKLSGFITAGHGRLEAFKRLKLKEVPVSYQDYESEEQEYADLQSDNAIASWAELDLSGINMDVGDLGPNFDIDLLGIKDFVLDISEKDAIESAKMADKFGAPPFSVLDARQGWWQERKRAWIAIGIQSELGRGGGGRNDGELQKPGQTLGATPSNQTDLYERMRK